MKQKQTNKKKKQKQIKRNQESWMHSLLYK